MAICFGKTEAVGTLYFFDDNGTKQSTQPRNKVSLRPDNIIR